MPETKEVTVKIKVSADTMVSVKAKEKLMLRISDLPQEYQEMVIELCENRNALKGLYENKEMLMSMLPK